MKMTILRAKKELEMDVDLEHRTEVGNVEWDDDQQMTIYGTEQNGELFYIVIDRALVEAISLAVCPA